MYTSAHSSVLDYGQKVETNQESVGRSMDKQVCSIHAIEYDSVLQRNEILTHVTI